MQYTIVHTSRYTYSAPVFLEPQTLRLHPRDDAWQRVEDYALEIGPRPAGCSEFTDAEGNRAVMLWFDNLVEALVRTNVV